MIRHLATLLLLACTAFAVPAEGGRYLAATVQAEDRGGRDGALGERGKYQFREITWRQHMPGVPFALARDPATADACALKHLAWLRRELRRAGIEDNAYNLALCWNAGLDAVLRGVAPERAYHYATRVEAIYLRLERLAVLARLLGDDRSAIARPAEDVDGVKVAALVAALQHVDQVPAGFDVAVRSLNSGGLVEFLNDGVGHSPKYSTAA